MSARETILVAFGTRPEAVKLAPVLALLRQDPHLQALAVATGQHRDLVQAALDPFGLVPDIVLDVMRPGQDLPSLTARLLGAMAGVIAESRPQLVMVQGDTTTTFAAALAAFYDRVPVAHVEAGLRTGDMGAPFPEEANRRLVGVLADLHFAPTPGARASLVAEGVPPERILVTGNTAVDALHHVAGLPDDGRCPVLLALDEARPIVLATAHRRENQGEPLARLCRALARLVQLRPDVQVVLPVHPSPAVRGVVEPLLADVPGIRLVAPLDYVALVGIMRRAALVITDSGGLQEEAPALGVPVLVCREATERPEGIACGLATLVGTDEAAIVSHALEILGSPDSARRTSPGALRPSPYGDGRASVRIVEACRELLAGRRSPAWDRTAEASPAR